MRKIPWERYIVMLETMTASSFRNFSKKLLKHNKLTSTRNNDSRVGSMPRCKVINSKDLLPVVIINEADSLSREAQAALRRTMEKYMSNMRIILCANSTSRLIAPIKSRCLLIRVAAPSLQEVILSSCMDHDSHIAQMETVLHYVAKRAPFDLPPEVAKKIADDSGGNLRKAILVLEALKMQSCVYVILHRGTVSSHLHV